MIVHKQEKMYFSIVYGLLFIEFQNELQNISALLLDGFRFLVV